MDRRGFLRFLGLGAAAAVAPTKAYSFLGNILRPKPQDLWVGNGFWTANPNLAYDFVIEPGGLAVIKDVKFVIVHATRDTFALRSATPDDEFVIG